METTPDLEKYEGGWENDKKSGRGVHTFGDGDIYDGEFQNGSWHGFGKLTQNLGKEVYEGGFEAGLRNGKGTQTFGDGVIYEGQFYNGAMEGKGK